MTASAGGDDGIARECVEGYLYTAQPRRIWVFRRPPERGGIWVPISGKVEPGDASLEAALRRELSEETGLGTPRRIVPIGFTVPFPAPDGSGTWRLTAFGVEVPSGWRPTLSREHVAAEPVPPSAAVGRLHYADNREAVGRLVAVLDAEAAAAGDRAPAGPPVYRAIDDALIGELRHAGHRRIALQVPAGLVRNAHDLAAELAARTGTEVVLTGRPCFGACDGPTPEEAPGADAAVVLGHAPIPNMVPFLPTYYVEMRRPPEGVDRLAGRIASAPGLPRRLGLVASVQHLDLVGPLASALAGGPVALVVGRGDRRLAYAAQALGCNYTGAEAIREEVDGYLFLGTGRFHPIGLAVATGRPVWCLDPLQGTLEGPIDGAPIVRRRQLLVAGLREARRWGILVSTFAGQNRMGTALALQHRARRRGREATIVSMARFDPRDLEGRDLDGYVSTACPRIALDDSDLYPRPVLTPPEFLMALGELPLEPYRFDTYH
ncbi:MAG: diphthamide biosynthesis enzyme Dph2 [Thermoplasmata archaeon]